MITTNVGSPLFTAILGPQGPYVSSGSSGDLSIDNNNVSDQSGTPPMSLGLLSSNLTISEENGVVDVSTQSYSLNVANDNGYVDYTIHPYFSDDFIRYMRVDPLTPGEGTVDKNGTPLDSVNMSIAAYGLHPEQDMVHGVLSGVQPEPDIHPL